MKLTIIFAIAVSTAIFMHASSTKHEPKSKEELGKMLFFDPILSSNRTISCATCHKPEFAFADFTAVSKGVEGKRGTRNTPSAMNLRLQRSFFWDGRAGSLQEQALAPIANPVEMNLPIDIAVWRLQKDPAYSSYFKKIFGTKPTAALLGEAIAAFEQTLETSDSPFDNWRMLEDSNAVTDAVKRGFFLFNNKGKCVKCHFGADFTSNDFRNIGLFNGKNLNDSGRAAVTHNKEDIGKFKSAGLRNVALTAPYMHNGMFKTLKEVINFYNDPAKVVPNGINRDSVLAKPLGLTEKDKADLEAFLISLTDKRF
jgi:cytochrome c peroxidase